MKLYTPSILSFLIGVTAITASADEKSKDSLTAKVTRGDLRVDVTLAGKFEAKDKDEITMKPKAYQGELIVKKVLSDGTPVKKGDVLIEFEPKSLDQAITKAEADIEAKQLEFTKKKGEHQAFRLEQDNRKHSMKQNLMLLENDLKLQKEQFKAALLKQKDSLRNTKESLEDAKINFKQFEELYKARELNTATEDILLKREKRGVRAAEERLAQLLITQKNARDFTLNKAVIQAELALEKKRTEQKQALLKVETDEKEKLVGVAQAKKALDGAKTRLEDLKKDRETLKILSPRDGVLFYGSFGNGGNPFGMVMNIGGGRGGDVKKELHQGGRVRTHIVLLTIASMKKLSIVMDAREIDIQHIKQDQPFTAIPDAYSSMKIEGKIKKVGHIAKRQGFSFSDTRLFPVEADYEYKESYSPLRAGMNCKVTIHSEKIGDVLQVPILAVFEENGKHYCLIDNDGEAEKRPIVIGKTNGKQVEIKEGLREKQTVYLYNPNEE